MFISHKKSQPFHHQILNNQKNNLIQMSSQKQKDITPNYYGKDWVIKNSFQKQINQFSLITNDKDLKQKNQKKQYQTQDDLKVYLDEYTNNYGEFIARTSNNSLHSLQNDSKQISVSMGQITGRGTQIGNMSILENKQQNSKAFNKSQLKTQLQTQSTSSQKDITMPSILGQFSNEYGAQGFQQNLIKPRKFAQSNSQLERKQNYSTVDKPFENEFTNNIPPIIFKPKKLTALQTKSNKPSQLQEEFQQCRQENEERLKQVRNLEELVQFKVKTLGDTYKSQVLKQICEPLYVNTYPNLLQTKGDQSDVKIPTDLKKVQINYNLIRQSPIIYGYQQENKIKDDTMQKDKQQEDIDKEDFQEEQEVVQEQNYNQQQQQQNIDQKDPLSFMNFSEHTEARLKQLEQQKSNDPIQLLKSYFVRQQEQQQKRVLKLKSLFHEYNIVEKEQSQTVEEKPKKLGQVIGATHENYVISKIEKKMRMMQLEYNKKVLDNETSNFDTQTNLGSPKDSLNDSLKKSKSSEHNKDKNQQENITNSENQTIKFQHDAETYDEWEKFDNTENTERLDLSLLNMKNQLQDMFQDQQNQFEGTLNFQDQKRQINYLLEQIENDLENTPEIFQPEVAQQSITGLKHSELLKYQAVKNATNFNGYVNYTREQLDLVKKLQSEKSASQLKMLKKKSLKQQSKGNSYGNSETVLNRKNTSISTFRLGSLGAFNINNHDKTYIQNILNRRYQPVKQQNYKKQVQNKKKHENTEFASLVFSEVTTAQPEINNDGSRDSIDNNINDQMFNITNQVFNSYGVKQIKDETQTVQISDIAQQIIQDNISLKDIKPDQASVNTKDLQQRQSLTFNKQKERTNSLKSQLDEAFAQIKNIQNNTVNDFQQNKIDKISLKQSDLTAENQIYKIETNEIDTPTSLSFIAQEMLNRNNNDYTEDIKKEEQNENILMEEQVQEQSKRSFAGQYSQETEINSTLKDQMVQTNKGDLTSKSYKSNRILIYTNQKSKSLTTAQIKKINELQMNSANIFNQAFQEQKQYNQAQILQNNFPRHISAEEGMHSRSNTNPKQLIFVQPRLLSIKQLEKDENLMMIESSLQTGLKYDSNQVLFEQLDLSIGTELMSKQKDTIQNTQSRSLSRGKIQNVSQIMIMNEMQPKRPQIATKQIFIGDGLSLSNKNPQKQLKSLMKHNQSQQIIQNGRWEPRRYKKFPRFAVQSGDHVKVSYEQFQKFQQANQTREFTQQVTELKFIPIKSDENTQYFDNTQVMQEDQIIQSNLRTSKNSNNEKTIDQDQIQLPTRISPDRKSQEFKINTSSIKNAFNQFQKTNKINEKIQSNRNNGIVKSNYESQGEKTTVKSQGSDKKINNASSRLQIFSVPSQKIVQIQPESNKVTSQNQFKSSATLAQKLDTISKSPQKSEFNSLVPKSEEEYQYKNTFTKIMDMQKFEKKMESIPSQAVDSGLRSEETFDFQKIPSPRYGSNQKAFDAFENILQLQKIDNQVLMSNRTLSGTNNVISNTYKVIHQRFQASQLASSLKQKLLGKSKQLYPVDPDFLSSFLGDLALDLELKNMNQVEKNELIYNLKIIRQWQIQNKLQKQKNTQTDFEPNETFLKSSPRFDKDEIQIVIEQLQSDLPKKSRTSDRKNIVDVQIGDKQNQLTQRDEQTIEAIVYNEQEFFNTNQSFLASQQNSQSISRQTPFLVKKSKQTLRDLQLRQSSNQIFDENFQPVVGTKKEIFTKNAEAQTKTPYQVQQDFEVNINSKSAITFSSAASNHDPGQKTLEIQSNQLTKDAIVNISQKPVLVKNQEIERQKHNESQNKDTIKLQSDVEVNDQNKGKIKKIHLTDSMTSSQLLEPKIPMMISKQSKSLFKDKNHIQNKKSDLDEFLNNSNQSQGRRFSGASKINKDLISNRSINKKSELQLQKSTQDEKGEFIIDSKSNKVIINQIKNDKMISSSKQSQKSIEKISRGAVYKQFDSTRTLQEERTLKEESGQMEIAVTIGTRRNLYPIHNEQRSQALLMSDFSLSSRNHDMKNNLVHSLLRTNNISESNGPLQIETRDIQQTLSNQKYKFTAGFKKQSKIIPQQQSKQNSTLQTQNNFHPSSPKKVEVKQIQKQEVQPLFLYQALQKANEQNLDLITYVLEDLALKYIKSQPKDSSNPPQEIQRQTNPDRKTRIKNMINDIYSKEKRYIPRGILIGSDRDPSLFINSQDLILDLTKAKGISLTSQIQDEQKESKKQVEGEKIEQVRMQSVKQMKQQQIIVLQEQKKIEEIAKQYSNLTISQQETPLEDTVNMPSYKISRQKSHKARFT